MQGYCTAIHEICCVAILADILSYGYISSGRLIRVLSVRYSRWSGTSGRLIRVLSLRYSRCVGNLWSSHPCSLCPLQSLCREPLVV